MVSLEGLTKIVDPSQLTADFEGSLEYNHDEWIEVLLLLLRVLLMIFLIIQFFNAKFNSISSLGTIADF